MQISGCILVTLLSVIICCAQNHLDLDYKYGTQYQYEYTVGVVTDEKSTRQFEPSKVNYTCQFSIKVFNGTGFLKITKVDFKDNFKTIDLDPESNDFTNYYLKFHMLPNGKVSNLYPDSREANWVLNFKRGLLSMFTFDEEDVHGKCPTRVSVTKHEDGDFLKRHKKTFHCEQTKPNSKFAIGSITFEFSKYMEYSVDNWYYDKERFNKEKRGQQECEGLVRNKIFQIINCTQEFNFDIGMGSMAFVDQRLKLLNIDAKATTANFNNYFNSLDFKPVADPKNLMYEAEDLLSPLNSKHYFEISKSHLSDMCKDDFERSSVDLVQKYLELTQAFGALSYEQLEALEKSSTCEFSKNVFLKALSYTRSYNSTLVMMDKLIKMKVSRSTEEQWLGQLSLEEYINKPILDKAYELLRVRGGNTSFALVAASIVNNYCNWYKSSCREDTKKFKSEFEGRLKDIYKHYGDYEQFNGENYLFIILKMIKSLKHSSELDVGILKTIAEDQKIKPFIRASVLDVYLDASNFKTNDLMKIFENPKEPIELRIAVYMKLYKREKSDFVPTIYKVLKEESPNQVTHYIWSHLRYHGGAKHSSNEEIDKFIKCKYTNCTTVKDSITKFSITDLINELFFGQELKVPKELETKEFSHYFEGGFSYQTNYSGSLIFTPASFLPSHVEFKVTPRRFNEANLEVFKIFADIEGFDDYFLSIFELEGRSLSKKLEEQKMWKRRSTKREDDVRFSIGSDFFGKHYMYQFFHGDRELKHILNAISTLDKINVTMNGLDSNYNGASVIIDHVESLPTAAGFPVRYNLKAVFMRNVTILGKIESDNFKNTREIQFDCFLEQFYGLGFSRHLSVDTYLTESITKYEALGMFKPKVYAKFDVQGFNHVLLDVGLVVDEETRVVHVRVEHYPGSRYNKTLRGEIQKIICNEYYDKGSMQMCYPLKIESDLYDKEYIDVPITFKKIHVEDTTPNITINWNKIEDSKYVLNITSLYLSESIIKNVNFQTKNGNLCIDVPNESNTTDFFFEANYKNIDNAKYVKYSSSTSIPEIYMQLYDYLPFGPIIRKLF